MFVARTRGAFWSVRPANILLAAVVGTQILATVIAVSGLLMTPLPWQYAALAWGWALAWFLALDAAKLATYRILDRPHGQLAGGRPIFCVGGFLRCTLLRESVAEVDLEREQRGRPVARSRPRWHGVDDGEIDQFLGGLLVGEMSFRLDRLAQLTVQGVGCQNSAHFPRNQRFAGKTLILAPHTHLRRDFTFHADLGLGSQETFGLDGLEVTWNVFHAWKQFQRDGDPQALQQRIAVIKKQMRPLLEWGSTGKRQRQVHALAKNLLKLWPALWTFADVPDVEPTNNAAERGLRAAVIYRKLSFGSRSQGGERTIERLLSVDQTCRLQRRSLYGYLSDALTAKARGDPVPSLT